MERFYLKKSLLLFSLFLASYSLFSQEEVLPIFPLEYFTRELNQLPFREEANSAEKKLIGLLEQFFHNNGVTYQKINYFPSPIIQSFSEGLEVSFKGDSIKNTYFVFPLDQKKGASSKSNNTGILIALKAIIELSQESFFLKENIHFLFLGGELTRGFPVGSRFFIENSPINLNNSFFYYFEISDSTTWQIRTQGVTNFYITPREQLKVLLNNLKEKKINFTIIDSYPLKNSFVKGEAEPFSTYDDLLLPLVVISSEENPTETNENLKVLEEGWLDFFYNLAYQTPLKSFNETNEPYLFFKIKNMFFFLKSSYYISSIFILFNLITFFSMMRGKYSTRILSKTIQSFWFFIFIFFLFFSSLTATSWVLPLLMREGYNSYPSSLLIYFKLSFSSFISFSFLYLIHKSVTIFYKQSFLYMSLLFFASLGFIVSFYNILSSFFFFTNGLFIFLGILSPPLIRFLFNVLAFASFFLFIEMGMSKSWIDYFESVHPQINLIITSAFLPFLFLILSYTTPNKKKIGKEYSRYLFSKIQISLLLATIFALIISFEISKNLKEEKVTIKEIWKKEGSTTEHEINYSQQIEEDSLRNYIEELIEKNQRPNYLQEKKPFLALSLEDTSAFHRNDFLLEMEFPFQPESLSLVLNTNAQLIPIIYKSSFPYEINEKNTLSFIIGPNPPKKLSIDLSLEELPFFDYTIKFSRVLLEETLVDEDLNKKYKIIWTQEVLQKGSLDKKTKDTSNLLDVSELEKDTTFIRLRNLPLPLQSLIPKI